MNRSKTPIRMRFFATNALRAVTIALMVSALASPLHAEVDAELGKKLFKANCASCHNGFLLTNQAFENNGIEPAGSDSGRARITGLPEDFLTFRVPSLRNVEKTAPYMHDGRFQTLDDVIAHYDRGGSGVRNQSPQIQPLQLTESEKQDLIAFLKTLTDDIILTGISP